MDITIPRAGPAATRRPLYRANVPRFIDAVAEPHFRRRLHHVVYFEQHYPE